MYDLFFQNFQSMKYSIGWYPSNKVLYIVVGKLKWLLERKNQNKLIEVSVYEVFQSSDFFEETFPHFWPFFLSRSWTSNFFCLVLISPFCGIFSLTWVSDFVWKLEHLSVRQVKTSIPVRVNVKTFLVGFLRIDGVSSLSKGRVYGVRKRNELVGLWHFQ